MKQLLLAKTHTPFTGKRGFYSSCEISNVQRLLDLCKVCGIPQPDVSELHCTVIYAPDVSPLTVEQAEAAKSRVAPRALIGGFAMFGPDKDTLVATLISPELAAMNANWVSLGFVPTFPEYRPHITLRKDSKLSTKELDSLHSKLQCLPEVRILFDREVLEDIED